MRLRTHSTHTPNTLEWLDLTGDSVKCSEALADGGAAESELQPAVRLCTRGVYCQDNWSGGGGGGG